MIPLTTYAGKNIALFGLGGSGLVTAKSLIAGGANVTAYDDNRASVEHARDQGIYCQDLRECEFSDFDELVLAPGVPLTHPKPHWSVELARNNGIAIIGDIELFCRERKSLAPGSTLIAITGTNGKSTTTALIAHILNSAGKQVEMGGNIGRAVLDFELIDDDVIYVVEVSSYQIDLAPGIDAELGIFLNLSADHLDRHGTMENYARIKTSMVEKAKFAIVGIDDPASKAAYSHLLSSSVPVAAVSVRERVDDGIYAQDGTLYFARDGLANSVADLDGIVSLRGYHNAQNACVAWIACKIIGLSDAEIQSGLSSFPGLIDRMEILGDVDGILIVNDSKGTNADATDMALGSFSDIFWIAGGLSKSGGIEPLRHHFPKIIKAFLIGDAAPLFAGTLGDSVDYEISQTLETALEHALADARKFENGEKVILMSPSCASFDQFKSYAARGEHFRQLVSQVEGFQPRSTL